MIVVSDTTTITNLWQIQRLQILQHLYAEIIIPKAVWEELSEISEQYIYLSQQDWIIIQEPHNTLLIENLSADLDIGEAQAIALSVELEADFLIIDERAGRNKAKSLNIKIIGLLGILLEAKRQGVIFTVKDILEKLEDETSFFINPKLYQEVLRLAGE
jgi:hypothetical protein